MSKSRYKAVATIAGRAYGPELLPLVGDPVRLRGRVFRHGDLLVLGAPLTDIQCV